MSGRLVSHSKAPQQHFRLTYNMAATTSREHNKHKYLPPSPPPSPPLKRRGPKKRSNSFEKFANTPLPSPPSSPSQGPLKDQDKEPLITKLVLTPLFLISFILSLSFVNLRDRARRTYAHSNPSYASYFYPSRWLDLEPYQDSGDSRWCRQVSTTHVLPHDAISPREGNVTGRNKRRSWHLNKKIRKVTRLEVSDAFEMRGKVIVGILVAVGLGLSVLGLLGKWLFMMVMG
ncbi:hypothetical protein GQ44DRAFT_698799 [Phaeosphaeriaceae sp. PMI808]|nr:hypothetical protein GQ44DRAFT_698799 [Phaeosphaeriaceae sp. PMI808]